MTVPEGVRDAALLPSGSNHVSTAVLLAATASLIWYCMVCTMCIIGFVQTLRRFSRPPLNVSWNEDAPDVTIIRPIKGLEPCLYETLVCTFRQMYPKHKTHIRFCIANRREPCLPILNRLLHDFPDLDAQILVEEEDTAIQDGSLRLGPNPKIRNMSRAYREAMGDVIWLLDCNVWLAKGALGRMVARLQGVGEKYPNKFVHHLPLVVSIAKDEANNSSSFWNSLGSRVEEMFLSTAHGKFYVAINTLLVVNATIGKSNMFRRSHLDSLTGGQGIDFFSANICEDYLLGNLLFKKKVPAEATGDQVFGRHALSWGDVTVQPMTTMSVQGYWSRRIRWNRARMFAVPLATFVEPFTESILCSFFGAFAFTTLPFFNRRLGIPQTWLSFFLVWLLSVSLWSAADRVFYLHLNSASYLETDENTPEFARLLREQKMQRPLGEWLVAWLLRELIASPVELWAFWGGSSIEWRGKRFRVSKDMTVHGLDEETPQDMNGRISKARIE